jgi:hypothetical protein
MMNGNEKRNIKPFLIFVLFFSINYKITKLDTYNASVNNSADNLIAPANIAL